MTASITHETTLAVPVPTVGAGQVLYAAAFIDPAVRRVAIRDDPMGNAILRFR